MTKDMTNGSPMKLILGFSIPLLFGYLFQQFYNLVDTLIVGRFLGVDALAAVGSTGSLNFLIIGFCMGVCNGFAIPLAHKFGAGDYRGLRAFMVNAIYLSAIFAVVMTAVTVVFCRPILCHLPDILIQRLQLFNIFVRIFLILFLMLRVHLCQILRNLCHDLLCIYRGSPDMFIYLT